MEIIQVLYSELKFHVHSWDTNVEQNYLLRYESSLLEQRCIQVVHCGTYFYSPAVYTLKSTTMLYHT